MPSNNININNGLEYRLSDKKMPELLFWLDKNGERRDTGVKPKRDMVMDYCILSSDKTILTTNTHINSEVTPDIEVKYNLQEFEANVKAGYKEMGNENIKLSEEFLSIESEDWPDWGNK